MASRVATRHGRPANLVVVEDLGSWDDEAEEDAGQDATIIAILKGQLKLMSSIAETQKKMAEGQKETLEVLKRIEGRLKTGVRIKLF